MALEHHLRDWPANAESPSLYERQWVGDFHGRHVRVEIRRVFSKYAPMNWLHSVSVNGSSWGWFYARHESEAVRKAFAELNERVRR